MQFIITKRDRTKLTVFLSDEDADLAELPWSMAGGKGRVGKYVASTINGKRAYIHRVVAERMGLEVAPAPGRGRWRVSVDHVNGDKLDNRRENLRVTSRPEQMTNPADGLRSTNTSGHRGVSLIRKSGKWMAHVTTDGRSVSLGLFDSKEEAIARRAEWDRSPWPVPPRREIQPCGTSAGYQRHLRRGERACEACLVAAAERVRAYNARKKTG